VLFATTKKTQNRCVSFGGERGIRTPETGEGLRAFQARALDHYAISPWSKTSKILSLLQLLVEAFKLLLF
jgi:hypothetical protein